MADIRVLTYKNDTDTSGTWSAGAASFTVPLGTSADHRAVLLVDNRNTDVVARLAVSAGDGIRKDLGGLSVDIAASSLAVVPFTDSMRFKVMTTGDVTCALTDTSNTALTAGPLANIKTLTIKG